jgi:vancomycin resistance protein VanJ
LLVTLPALHAVALGTLVGVLRVCTFAPAEITPLSFVVGVVAMLGEFTPWFFLPLPLWLLTAALGRSRRAVLTAALPWALFAALYGHMLVPYARSITQTASVDGATRAPETTLRLMTFNVGSALYAPNALVNTVTRVAPDVLFIQELTEDMARALGPRLVGTYPYYALRLNRPVTQGIWSRFPLSGAESWDCPPETTRDARTQHAVLNVNGQRVQLVNAHPHPPSVRWQRWPQMPLPLPLGETTERRWNEVTGLARCIAPLLLGPDPVIVAGDFNLTQRAPEYRILRGIGLHDTHGEVGLGFGLSFPARPATLWRGRPVPPVPLVRIDYIWHSDHVQALGVRVGESAGTSDHHPLIADLKF